MIRLSEVKQERVAATMYDVFQGCYGRAWCLSVGDGTFEITPGSRVVAPFVVSLRHKSPRNISWNNAILQHIVGGLLLQRLPIVHYKLRELQR